MGPCVLLVVLSALASCAVCVPLVVRLLSRRVLRLDAASLEPLPCPSGGQEKE